MKRTLLLLALLWVTSLLVQADQIEEQFKAFDTNKDGTIAGEELKAAKYLPKLDLNQDGKLTLEEARKALQLAQKISQQKPGKTGIAEFDHLDKNGNGLLSADELPQKRWMKLLDLDKNGVVTLAEATEAMGKVREKKNNTPPRTPTIPAHEDPALTEAPEILKGSEHGIGLLVQDLSVKILNGEAKKLSELMVKEQGLVIAYFGATCPISHKLGPELARLEKDTAAKKVKMILVCPVAVESIEDIHQFTTDHALKSPVIHDQDGQLTSLLAAATTTEIFLLDTARTLVYRGAINDQYGLGYTKPKPNKTYFRDALAFMLKGEAPQIAATTAPGCALDLKISTSPQQTTVTYYHQISRIIQSNCLECHRKGAVGPFSLESPEDVIEHAGMIRKQVQRGAMPPWFAAESLKDSHTPWINDTSLSKSDKHNLLTWLGSDRPLGDPADAPKPRTFPKEWAIGTPDTVVQLPKPVTIPAEGIMPYQFITTPTDFAEDQWVQGYEIMPTDRSVVHHVIVQIHPKGADIRDRGEGSEGYWAAYVPGNATRIWPSGFAKKLPAGATMSFQIHYTPNGKQTQDQLRIGLIFAKEKPRYEVHTAAVVQSRLNIPAGAPNHLEFKEQKVPFNMNILACMAHMHVRGKAFKFEVTHPDGEHEVLLDIPRYDFNWQLRYDYAKPKFIPEGSKIKISARFDNSDKNPANPDPSRNVQWGQQTYDEMMIGYFEFYASANTVVSH